MSLWCHWVLHRLHGMTEKVFCRRNCRKLDKPIRRVRCEGIEPFGSLWMLFLVKCVLFEWVYFEIFRYLFIVAMYIIMTHNIFLVMVQVLSVYMKSYIYGKKDKVWRLEKQIYVVFFLLYFMWSYELTTMLVLNIFLAFITSQSILFLNSLSLAQK